MTASRAGGNRGQPEAGPLPRLRRGPGDPARRALGAPDRGGRPAGRRGRLRRPPVLERRAHACSGLARRIVLPHGWPALDDPRGCDGIELWSLTTDAAEAWRTPAEALRWLRDPEPAIAAGPPAHHLRRWDALSARRRVPAIGGLDGHQPGIRVRGRVRSPLPHRRTFDLLRTHLLCERPLTGDVEADWRTVLAALAAGAAWLTCPCVAPAHGARLWAERSDGTIVPMGAEAPAGPSVLRVRLPQEAELRVVRDGAPFHGRTARSWTSRSRARASTASRRASTGACGCSPTPFTCALSARVGRVQRTDGGSYSG